MRIKGIDHVTINLKDVARSLWFYGELLGFERLPDVDMGLELTEYRYETADCGDTATDKGRARHLAFEVEDVYALEKKLTDAGYLFHVPVSHVEKLGFSGGLTRDPNGFELEFLQYD